MIFFFYTYTSILNSSVILQIVLRNAMHDAGVIDSFSEPWKEKKTE